MPRKWPKNLVLDAWAVLALLQGEEPAAGKVLEAIQQAEAGHISLHMSWINLGEVFYIIGRRRGEEDARETLEEIRLLPIQFHEIGKKDIIEAASLKMRFPLSYADAFAVALTVATGGPLLTGDPEILRLNHHFPLESLKRS